MLVPHQTNMSSLYTLITSMPNQTCKVKIHVCASTQKLHF